MDASAGRVAVTGASGFVGSRVVAEAARRGWQVVGLSRDIAARGRFEGLLDRIDIVDPGTYAPGDLARALEGCTALVHLVATGTGDAAQLRDVNVGIVDNIVAACRKAGVPRIVHVSGLGAGDPGAWPVDSRARAFLEMKHDAELRIQASDVAYVIFRPSFVAGPGDYVTGAIVRGIMNGVISLPASRDVPLQPVHVDDLVDALLLAASRPGAFTGTIDACGAPVTIGELVGMVVDAMKATGVSLSPPVIREHDAGPGIEEEFDFLVASVAGDADALPGFLGRPLVPVETIVREAVRAILRPDEVIPPGRAVMLLSGGLDSVTALYWARREGHEVHPVSMEYGGRPSKEAAVVKEIAARLGLDIITVPVPYIKEVLELKLDGYPVPSIFGSGDYYVPYRNLVFNSIATYFADVLGASWILSGHIVSDPLPDASGSFFDRLEALVASLKVGHKAVAPRFMLPFKGKTKADVVRLAIELGVPLALTWSCAFDMERPCGQCKPCRERREAFASAGVADPLEAPGDAPGTD